MQSWYTNNSLQSNHCTVTTHDKCSHCAATLYDNAITIQQHKMPDAEANLDELSAWFTTGRQDHIPFVALHDAGHGLRRGVQQKRLPVAVKHVYHVDGSRQIVPRPGTAKETGEQMLV